MPSYYLQTRARSSSTARAVIFADDESAGRESMRPVANAWRSLASPADPSRYALEITNEVGQALLMIPFAIALEAD